MRLLYQQRAGRRGREALHRPIREPDHHASIRRNGSKLCVVHHYGPTMPDVADDPVARKRYDLRSGGQLIGCVLRHNDPRVVEGHKVLGS
jgi:hypothetical protein